VSVFFTHPVQYIPSIKFIYIVFTHPWDQLVLNHANSKNIWFQRVAFLRHTKMNGWKCNGTRSIKWEFLLNIIMNQYTLSIITSQTLFGLGASLSLVNYARWLAHDSWERGSQAKWRNYRKGVLLRSCVKCARDISYNLHARVTAIYISYNDVKRGKQ
jgi:hypothetical protein